ncbi:MAG: TatD family hydrolase [Candidatus Pacebacteria bacterium]|nr:TatD family hydrolase [Candidatus Paceibacterota bacterium]
MKFQFVDIHTHVNFVAFEKDREEVIQRASDAGVAMINVGTQVDTSKKAIEMAEKYENCYAIVGLHPVHTSRSFHDEKELGEGGKEFTSRGEQFDTSVYRSMLKHPKVVGIGECGLDYYHLDEESIKIQRENFEMQIDLANEAGKSLMLHVRSNKESGKSAYKDALEILKARAKVKGNFHFFAGSWEEAKEILDFGYTISFTGVITFARDYDEVIKNAPLDMIMSETDAPYVSPAPFRGKRNEPAHVREVVKKIAEIRGEDYEKVPAQLAENAGRVFGLW